MNIITSSVRSLIVRPGYFAVATGTVGLGIAVSAALFSVVNSVLLRPLHYPDSERIISIQTRMADTGRIVPRIAGPDLLDIRGSQAGLAAISYFRGGEGVVQFGGHAELAGVCFAPPDFFRVFGLAPVAGSWYTSANEMTAVLADGLAKRRFGSAGQAIGKLVEIDGRGYEVRGVAPESLDFPPEASIWIPSRQPPPTERRSALNYSVLARLANGAHLSSVQKQLEVLALNLGSAYVENRNRTFHVIPLRDYIVGRSQQTLKMMMVAGVLVLLVCCANVANLTLAQATRKYKEVAVRLALGARRATVIRQFATENALVVAAGAAVGFAASRIVLGSLLQFVPDSLPRLNEIAVDLQAFVYTVGVTLACSVVTGILPAWMATGVNVSDSLKLNAGRQAGGWGSARLRSLLLTSEISICFALAVGAGLLLRSYQALAHVELGFDPHGIVISYANMPAHTPEQYREAGRRIQALATEVSTMPEVESSSAVMGVPAGMYTTTGAVTADMEEADRSTAKVQAGLHLATPAYFHTMRTPFRQGRDFSSSDTADRPFVAIVNQALVTQMFHGEDAIGKRIRCDLDSDAWMTIVGIVGNMRQRSGVDPEPEVYMPVLQHPTYSNELQLVTRVRNVRDALPQLERRIEALDSRVAIRTTTLPAMLRESTAIPRFRAVLVTFFAVLALTLAVLGVYSVMSYVVAQRTAEIGIRAALGATPGNLASGVVLWAARVALVGAIAGTLLMFGLARALSSFLYGVQVLDPTSYASALTAVLMASWLGAFVPAWRASAVDPIISLRNY